MLLYHGSNVEVNAPKILVPSHALDFGPGFYTTLNRDQAVDFARKVVLRKGGIPIVNEYELDEKIAFEFCDLLKFDQPDEIWLNFVCACRDGINVAEGRDLVLGLVADDDVYRTLALYREGEITKDETLARLRIKQLYNQLVFATTKALTFIRFRKAEVIA